MSLSFRFEVNPRHWYWKPLIDVSLGRREVWYRTFRFLFLTIDWFPGWN